MSYTKEIFKKEVKSYFLSPAAYIVLGFFLLISGWFFTNTLFVNNQADLRTLFNIIPLLYIVFIPAITMGLISREKDTSTIEILMTLPIKKSEIILGKFWSSLFIISVGLILTFVHFTTIALLAEKSIDTGQIICGYFGIFLVGAVYSAIGIFSSTLSKNQLVSFLIGFAIIFFFFIIQKVLIFVPNAISGFFQYISIDYHLSGISRGIIDTRNLVYFISIILFFLKLSEISLLKKDK